MCVAFWLDIVLSHVTPTIAGDITTIGKHKKNYQEHLLCDNIMSYKMIYAADVLCSICYKKYHPFEMSFVHSPQINNMRGFLAPNDDFIIFAAKMENSHKSEKPE